MAGELIAAGLGSSFSRYWNILLTVLTYGWPFILLIIMFIQKSRWSKFPIEAIIFEKRGENLVKTNDRVGKVEDRYSDMTYYRLKKSGDTIPVYNFDWVLHNVASPTNLMERYINLLQGNSGTIFLFRYGSKQYKPINMTPGQTKTKKLVEVLGSDGKPVYNYQYIQFDPRKELGLLEFEVIDWDNMNFMVQEQRATIVRRQKKGEFWKQTLLPLAALAAVALVSVFMLKFSYDAGSNLQGGGPPPDGGSIVGGAIDNVITPGE
jgi:hypothetical protein|tara:strand:- start:7947 stop:8738 length:792 start_codon:yes stop_codon:yes gene_type:complete